MNNRIVTKAPSMAESAQGRLAEGVSRFVSRFSLIFRIQCEILARAAEICGLRKAGMWAARILVPAFAGSNPAAPAREVNTATFQVFIAAILRGFLNLESPFARA